MLFCLLPGIAVAEPLTLSQAVSLALEHAPAMQAAEAGRDAAAEDADIGRAALLPYVQASGSYRKQKQNTKYDVPQAFFKTDLNYGETFVGLRAVQPLFDLERWAGYRQGEISAETGELRLRMERQRLMLETAQAALTVITAQAALDAAEARERAAGKLAAEARAAFKAGTKAKTERLEAEARFDLVKAERLAAANNLDQARATLASLIGGGVEVVAMPKLTAAPQAPDNPVQWEQQAAEHALPVLLARLQLELAKEERSKALGSGLPKVEAFAEVGRSRAGDSMLGSATTVRSRAVGVQLKVPLYAGGGPSAQVRKSEKERVQAEYALADDVRLARLSARQACLALQAAAMQVAAMQKARLSAREAAEAAHIGHRAGLRSMTDVLDADELRYRTERDLAIARAQYVAATLQLKASVGELDTGSLPDQYGGKL